MVKSESFQYFQSSPNDQTVGRMPRDCFYTGFDWNWMKYERNLKYSPSSTLCLNHNSTGVPMAVPLPNKLVIKNRRFVHKTVLITLKVVSEALQENYKVETFVTVEIRIVDGT